MLNREEIEIERGEEEKSGDNNMESFIQGIPPEERKIAEAYLHIYD